MAKPNKIDQLGLSEKVLELATTNTSRGISMYLQKQHNVDISHVAVARYIQGTRKERAETTKALVQETIKATVPKDLELLERLRDEQAELVFNPITKSEDPELWLKATKELRATIESRLKHSGAEEQSDDNKGMVVVFDSGMGE